MQSKKVFGISLMAMVFALMLVIPAFGAERVIDLPITNKVTSLDRNGVEYTRFIVEEAKKIQGVSYSVGVPAMAFGEVNEGAKALEIGGNLKAIVQDRSFQGRSSMTIIKLLE